MARADSEMQGRYRLWKQSCIAYSKAKNEKKYDTNDEDDEGKKKSCEVQNNYSVGRMFMLC